MPAPCHTIPLGNVPCRFEKRAPSVAGNNALADLLSIGIVGKMMVGTLIAPGATTEEEIADELIRA